MLQKQKNKRTNLQIMNNYKKIKIQHQQNKIQFQENEILIKLKKFYSQNYYLKFKKLFIRTFKKMKE